LVLEFIIRTDEYHISELSQRILLVAVSTNDC